MTSPTQSVAIVGQPKTGTTALYSSLKNQGGFECLHEPTRPGQVEYLVGLPGPHLVKILLHTFYRQLDGALPGFDKQLLIVRDPRDVFISWLLYRPLMRGNWRNEAFMGDFLEALEAKERDPGSVAVHELYDVLTKHDVFFQGPDSFQQFFRLEDQFAEDFPDHCRVRYEDVVAGELDHVEEYLGYPVERARKAPAHAQYNVRSKAAGKWRHWFTPSDRERYEEAFAEQIQRYGYPEDWELADEQVIDPAVSSEYLRRNIARFQDDPPSYGTLLEPSAYGEQRLDALRGAITDGADGAMLEYGLVRLSGHAGERSLDEGIELLAEAGRRGHLTALAHLAAAEELGFDVPGEPGSWWQAACAISSSKAASRRAEQRPFWAAQHRELPGRAARIWRRLLRRLSVSS